MIKLFKKLLGITELEERISALEYFIGAEYERKFRGHRFSGDSRLHKVISRMNVIALNLGILHDDEYINSKRDK